MFLLLLPRAWVQLEGYALSAIIYKKLSVGRLAHLVID